jgi:hypothetical protein
VATVAATVLAINRSRDSDPAGPVVLPVDGLVYPSVGFSRGGIGGCGLPDPGARVGGPVA